MNSALQQFLSLALPIMVTLVATIWIAQWSQNNRFDDMGKRFEDLDKRFDDLKSDMNRRFDRVETKLDAMMSGWSGSRTALHSFAVN